MLRVAAFAEKNLKVKIVDAIGVRTGAEIVGIAEVEETAAQTVEEETEVQIGEAAEIVVLIDVVIGVLIDLAEEIGIAAEKRAPIANVIEIPIEMAIGVVSPESVPL